MAVPITVDGIAQVLAWNDARFSLAASALWTVGSMMQWMHVFLTIGQDSPGWLMPVHALVWWVVHFAGEMSFLYEFGP